MQHILSQNSAVKNNAIFALCFVTPVSVLWNSETNPELNLNFSDGKFEWSKVTVM